MPSSPHIPKRVAQVITLLREAGATECMLVGGWVRDHLMGIDSKDIDLEVYGLGYDEIVVALKGRFNVNLVGKCFGVVKVGDWLDINIPRRESKHGVGHTGFTIEADPTMTPYEATARRDFTVNAIGLRGDGTFHDPFDGIGDIERRLLRAVTDAYKEDPLRVLRGMQFAARFGFKMDDPTLWMSRQIIEEFDDLSPERVWEEFRKWASKGKYPEKGLDVLFDTGWFAKFPELMALWELNEGESFFRICQVCNRAAELATKGELPPRERTLLLMAALCHDFGSEGAVEFLERMRSPGWVAEHVERLVSSETSCASVRAYQDKKTAVNWLAYHLKPATVRLWSMLQASRGEGELAASVLDAAEALGIANAPPEPVLQGRDLIAAGVRPGPAMGKILRQAFEAQLNREFTDLSGANAWLRQRGLLS